MNETKKHREWVKTAAIIFLAVLLVLTFFSGTIQNHSLPEVAVEYATSGTMSSGIRVSGAVKASQTYSLTLEETRTVKTVKVRNGDEVAVGDVLFELEDAESDELKAAQKQLETLQTAYEKAKLGLTDADTAAEEQTVANAKKGYENAVAARNAFSASLASSDEQKALDTANRVLESLKMWRGEAYNSGVIGLSNDIAVKYYAAYIGVDAAALFKPTTTTKDKLDENGKKIPVNDASGKKPSEEGWVETYETENVDVPGPQTFDNLVSGYETYYGTILDAAKADVNKANWNLSQTKQKYEDDIAAAKLAWDNAQTALDAKKKSNASSTQISKLDLADQAKAIEEQKDTVAKLKEKYTDATVTAKMAGTVTDVAAVAGQKLEAGTPAVVIQLTDKGYAAEVSVTKEQVARIKVGDSATVSGYYWGDTPTAVITGIRVDTTSTKGDRLVTLTLTGDVQVGSNYNFVLGERSSSYDCIVPKSALREDNNGAFVLSVTSKNTPLGNRYFATRVNVKVKASNDTQAAVTADFGDSNYGMSYVITSSSVPIEAGAQVRLASGS